MTIEQTHIVDGLGIDSSTGKVHLTISDHLDWALENEGRHLLLLQDKLNTYLNFVENDEHLAVMPEAANLSILFVVIGRYEPSEAGMRYLEYASNMITEAGFELKFEHQPASEDVH